MAANRRIATLALMALVLLAVASAASAAPVGSFTKVEGAVDILRSGSTAVMPVRTGDPVSMGDAVRTKRGGKAEIQFRDQTVIQLAPESRILIDEYSFNADESRGRGFLSLFRGKVRAVVSKVKAAVVSVGRTDAGFNIKTPTAVAGVRGTDFIVYYQRGVTGVVFLEGTGFAYNPAHPNNVVTIRGGQASFISNASAPPTNARTISQNVVSTHLKETAAASSGSGGGSDSPGGNQGGDNQSGGNQGGGQGGSEQGPLVTVVAANTTADSLMVTTGGTMNIEPMTSRTIILPAPPTPVVSFNTTVSGDAVGGGPGSASGGVNTTGSTNPIQQPPSTNTLTTTPVIVNVRLP